MTAVMLSGGPDSTVLTYELVRAGTRPLAIVFDLGDEEAPRSVVYARRIAADLDLEILQVDLAAGMRDAYRKPFPQFLRAAQVMSHEIEPFGSGVALSIAASLAASRGHSELHYGVHRDDTMYRDNNAEYFSLLSRAISIETGRQFDIRAPFLNRTKAEVLQHGARLGVDLSGTWSCAHAGAIQCGTCLPCTLRQEAFSAAGLTDRTAYSHERLTPPTLVTT